LLFLGRIHPKKGLSNLIAALHLSRSNRRLEEWHLVVAGWDDGGHLTALKRQVDDHALSNRVHFVGPQFGECKSATLSAADAFILPSFSEGLPMAVLEAWAYGKAVLMTDACNLPEGFASSAAIKLDTDPSVLAEQLCAFSELSSSDIIEMGGNGRRLAEASFSWAAVAGKMKRLYEWSIAGGTAPEFVSVR
jgi:glycosyltransferase involved in cell wall biosynthesis